MKQKKTNGEDKKTSIWDVAIECIRSLKEFAIHVVDSEMHTLAGKANLIVIFAFLVFVLICTIMQSINDQISIPLVFYIFIGIGMMSCMISTKSLEKKTENNLRDIS